MSVPPPALGWVPFTKCLASYGWFVSATKDRERSSGHDFVHVQVASGWGAEAGNIVHIALSKFFSRTEVNTVRVVIEERDDKFYDPTPLPERKRKWRGLI